MSAHFALERLRVTQPPLQRLAVISVFDKLRSPTPHLGVDSDPGREAISRCLLSPSLAVADQAVHELCRMVTDSKMDISRGLLELQSALEVCNSRLVPLFVKAIGSLVRFGFGKNTSDFKCDSSETHLFIRVLACREDVQLELVQQILLFIVEGKRFGMAEVCGFLKPFLNFSILKLPFSDSSYSSSFSFIKHLISSVSSLCCSFPLEAMPIFKMLLQGMRCLPRKSAEDFRNFFYLGESMVNSFTVMLRSLVVEVSELNDEAKLCSSELLVVILSPSLDLWRHSGARETAVDLSKRLLVAHKDLGLPYVHDMSLLFFVLIQSELEHEQLSILKLLLFLLKWKSENENVVMDDFKQSEEVLFLFPVISLISSPSTPVKGVAIDLLFILAKRFQNLMMMQKTEVALHQGFPELSRPESIIFSLLQHLWFQASKSSCFFLNLFSVGRTENKDIDLGLESWISLLKEYTSCMAERWKAQPILHPQEAFYSEMPLLLGSVAGVLVLHPSLGRSAADSLAAVGVWEPKIGTTLLLAILFYNNYFSNKDIKQRDMLIKCLEMLPSLASHSVMMPFVVQTILPMLQMDAKPVLYATAARLLCKTWEINDRAFGTLHGILHPKWFRDFVSERNICISIAVSIRDVCRKNPDRGVDLILSVSACIESNDAIIQALGFQSLAHLCEADVIDFYTAWDVISKYVLGYSLDPMVAHSLCLLLRWGAIDAEAYPEASKNVLQILCEVGTSTHQDRVSQWAKARVSAFEALTHFEVFHIEKCLPDVKSKSLEFLVSETNSEVLEAAEGFEVKLMLHEHINRRRLVKEKKVTRNKIEKLVHVFPKVIFTSEKNRSAREFPGAALLCLSFIPKDVNNQWASEAFQTVHHSYEKALVDAAASLQLSRNILVAQLSLQSWKPFMHRWMKAIIPFLDTKASSAAFDRTSKAANDILKSLNQIAEESIPSSAENIALAIGALCAVLPPAVHAVKASASKFLMHWLSQYEHEYRQWSAAISLGLISSCLHVTDHKQKFENINGLLGVLCGSKNTLVRGACGVGLGFSCQDILTRAEAVENFDQEIYTKQELELLGKIVHTLSSMTCQITECHDLVRSITTFFPLHVPDPDIGPSCERCDDLEDDVWGVAGLILGLASSISAMYRAGLHDVVLKVKDLIISSFSLLNDRNEGVLSVGSCLAIPAVVVFCRRVELMDDNELGDILNCYRELISELVSVKRSGAFPESLLMASYIGAGNLLACILNEAVHSVNVEDIMELFKKGYSSPHPPSIPLGAMLGVVNVLGAGAGSLFLHGSHEQLESSNAMCSLLSTASEPYLTSLVQEMFLVAQNAEDHQLQVNAAWAISFLRCFMRPIDFANFNSSSPTKAIVSQPFSLGVSDDSLVMKLSLWLKNHIMIPSLPNINTVTAVLRCLSRCPRLPMMDWGTIIRSCMRYGTQHVRLSSPKKTTLREECILFSVAHADQFDALPNFLDELTDLTRFQSLELNLQSCLLTHLVDLNRIFSGSRVGILFNDVGRYFSSLLSYGKGYGPDQESLLRVSCWNGLYGCLDEASLDSMDYLLNIKKCMEVLFLSLPSAAGLGLDQTSYLKEYSSEEWSAAVHCLAKAPPDFLSDLLKVDLVQGHVTQVDVSKLLVKARLVRIGSIPLTDLAKLNAQILNIESDVIWGVLVQVVAALQHVEGRCQRQWLVDAVEISCVTNFPSTALQFVGLLSGSFCKYMPLLVLDPVTVLRDLPVTLTSLFSDPSWTSIARSLASHLWAATRRIHSWANQSGRDSSPPPPETIDESERHVAFYLVRVLHGTCFLLREHLPLEKQLWLANAVVP